MKGAEFRGSMFRKLRRASLMKMGFCRRDWSHYSSISALRVLSFSPSLLN